MVAPDGKEVAVAAGSYLSTSQSPSTASEMAESWSSNLR